MRVLLPFPPSCFMGTLFLVCAALGALVLSAQIVLGVIGLDHDLPDVDAEVDIAGDGLAEGLDLFGIRALSAGVAFYGVGGLAALSYGLPSVVAAAVALVPALLALWSTAFLMRQMMRLESDGSLRIDGAVGVPATVYLTIPGAQRGPGKVQLALQGRTAEYRAVTSEENPIPTGAPVIVVSVVDADTVEVVPTPSLGDVLDVRV